MIICLLQFTDRPTPAYDQVARYLRLWGHEVWVTSFDEAGAFVWDNGNGRQIVQDGPLTFPERLPKLRPFQTTWRHVSHFLFVQRLRETIRTMQPDIVQVNSASLRYNSQIPILMPDETAFILDFRQIGDRRRPTNAAIRLRNKIRSMTRHTSAAFLYGNACFLHTAGARKGLGDHWQRWGTVVPMGVNDYFLSSNRTAEGQLLDSDPVRFVYVGTLNRKRQLETIFGAIKAAADRNSDFEFHFLGRDVSEGYYQELIEQLGLEQIVSLVPPVPYSEVPDRLLHYDAAIAYVPYEPTDWSYHPTLKVLEYKATGIPIIATDVAPNRELVESGVDGFLCENTEEAFADAMLQLVEDRRLLKQIRENARNGRTGTNWAEVSRMYETLYERVTLNGKAHTIKSTG